MTARSNELTLDDIKPFLVDAKTSPNGQVVATCPLCGKKGHFYATQKQDKLLVYCQKCNAPGGDILKEFRRLGAKHEEPEPIDYKRIGPVEDYNHYYKNPDGTVAYYKRRRKWADGHKVFTFGYTDANGRTVFSKPEGCNNLYNLDLLAKHEQDTLYIVEGEKCADAMAKAGLLATTSNTGAQKNIKLSVTDKELLDSYPNKVVIPDNDDKGADYGAAWPGAKVLPLADIWSDCPRKGDVADYFAAGGNVDAIKNYKFAKGYTLSEEEIDQLTPKDLISSALYEALYRISDAGDREFKFSLLEFRARDVKATQQFKRCWKAFMMKKAQDGKAVGNKTKFPFQPLELACGEWETSLNGVYRMEQKGQAMVQVFASPIPIMPVEILKNVEDSTERVRLMFFKQGRWQEVTAPRGVVANKSKIVNLADAGVEVTSENAGSLVKYISTVVNANQVDLPTSKSINHLGWYESEFLPYSGEIKIDVGEEHKALLTAISEKGDLQTWVNSVRKWRENIYMRVTLAASFASVLVGRINALPFILHLWGGTEAGKTVAAMVAASVWGNPAPGRMLKSLNSTENAIIANAAVLKDLPFIGDELQTIKQRSNDNYDALIMNITEGIERGKLNADSGIRKQRNWSCAFIFTGEEPITKANSGGGVKNRVIEVECTESLIPKGQGNQIASFVRANYGGAGKAFIEAVKGLSDDDLITQYKEYVAMLRGMERSTDKQTAAMALILLADTLASEYVFGESDNLIDLEQCLAFMKSKQEVSAAERAYNIICDIITVNEEKFVSAAKDFNGYECWGKAYHGGLILISKLVLERQLRENGFDYEAVKKPWADKGYLIKTKANRYSDKYSINNASGNYIKLALPNDSINADDEMAAEQNKRIPT